MATIRIKIDEHGASPDIATVKPGDHIKFQSEGGRHRISDLPPIFKDSPSHFRVDHRESHTLKVKSGATGGDYGYIVDGGVHGDLAGDGKNPQIKVEP